VNVLSVGDTLESMYMNNSLVLHLESQVETLTVYLHSRSFTLK